jgi:inosose dehydratase
VSDLKWSYMDHWLTDSPRGPVWPLHARPYMDRYIQQLAGLGFAGFDTFVYRLPALAEMYGSIASFHAFIQDCGMEKITGIFTAYPNATRFRAPHIRETHDQIVADCRMGVEMCAGLGVENFIVMPTTTYYDVEPVTADKLKVTAELWNRVGEMTLAAGMKTTCHFEFWGAIRTAEELDAFFGLTDPRYVFYFCDTAQHTIAGVDPVALFEKYHDRCTGFHFKDTRDVDTTQQYRTPPDPELMAPGVERWFWEMGAGRGLVDFPALTRSILARDWSGWLTVELDKADIGGGSYAESACVAKWYIDHVLDQIRAGT